MLFPSIQWPLGAGFVCSNGGKQNSVQRTRRTREEPPQAKVRCICTCRLQSCRIRHLSCLEGQAADSCSCLRLGNGLPVRQGPATEAAADTCSGRKHAALATWPCLASRKQHKAPCACIFAASQCPSALLCVKSVFFATHLFTGCSVHQGKACARMHQRRGNANANALMSYTVYQPSAPRYYFIVLT